MKTHDTATGQRRVAVSGLGSASLGVLAFSGTVPATDFALRGFSPLVVGAGRTVIAAAIAGAVLLCVSRRLPPRRMLPGLFVVAAGCGAGFGMLSAIAFAHVSASHAAVVIGLLPLATATVAVLAGRERPSGMFWLSSVAGAGVVLFYAISEGAGSLQGADLLLFAALVLAAAGYATGGRLARELHGYEVAAWGLVLALPVALPIALIAWLAAPTNPSPEAVAGLLYVSVISMFVGFIPWYRGMALAGTARASQTQLLQPFLTVGWAMLLLGERPAASTLVAALLVAVCMASSLHARFTRAEPRVAIAEQAVSL